MVLLRHGIALSVAHASQVVNVGTPLAACAAGAGNIKVGTAIALIVEDASRMATFKDSAAPGSGSAAGQKLGPLPAMDRRGACVCRRCR